MDDYIKALTEKEIWKEVSVVVPTIDQAVGVTVSLNFPGMTRKFRREMKMLIVSALDALASIGTRPVLLDATALTLPSFEDHELHGLVVLGGGDVHPQIASHASEVPNSFGTDLRADSYTIDLVRRAADKQVPILGICRGAQVLNVAFGGTIVPDLGEGTLHRPPPGGPTFAVEDVALEKGSRVRNIYGSDQVRVRSAHHQAVDHVGERLRPTAWAEDGHIEAIEHQDEKWVVGVQWHPEAPEADRWDFLKLLKEFKWAMGRE